jgi:hypothetical protein
VDQAPVTHCVRQAVFALGLAAFAMTSHLDAQGPATWVQAPTFQQNGMSIRMPRSRPISRDSKLWLTIDTRWAHNYGYRPVEVTVNSSKPTTADHLITIRLYSSGWNWYGGELSVEQDFELPMGKTSVTTTVTCPRYRVDSQFVWWDVWVDGVKDDDLSMEKNDARTMGIMGGFAQGAQLGVSCLVVNPSGPGFGRGTRTLTSPNSMEFNVLSMGVAELPQRWIDYTCFDVLAIDSKLLQNLSQTNPDAFAALRRWVAAGGQLWACGLGPKFEELADLTKLFQLRPSIVRLSEEGVGDGLTVAEDNDAATAGWRPVIFRNGNPEGEALSFMNVDTGEIRTERDPQIIAQLQSDPSFVPTEQQFNPMISDENTGRRRRGPRENDSSRWFVEQGLGLGTVRAIRGANFLTNFLQGQFVSTVTPMGTVVESMGMNGEQIAAMGPRGPRGTAEGLDLNMRSTKRWDQRHGMTPGNANFEFANLLVPGVGLAPVTEFRVLITLFVLLIGPGNYWLLKRFKRLHLLVLTVPVAALLTTLSLFAYAVISDGFGTSVRAHSLTALDQRTGEAATWARLSFYSGLAPGEGLTMPNDVAVYPIVPGWNEGNVDANLGIERDLVWEGNEAKMTRGWLRSRTPTQFLTVRSRKSPRMLELATTTEGKVRATNNLGSKLEFVLVFDDKGNLFLGENLATDGRAFLQPIERRDAIRRWRDIVTNNQPEAPAELAAPDSDFMMLQRREQMRMYRRSGIQYGEQRLSTNLVSEMLDELAGLSNQPALNLPPRSYLAVAERGPEVELGMSGAEEEASFHVIVGQW